MTYHRRPRARGFALVLVVLAMVAGACSSSSDTTAAPTTAAPGTTAPGTTAPGTTAPPTTEVSGPSGEPIRVGSSLALTGFLAPTAAIHKLAGQIFIDRLNASGGLLGRPVRWTILDDESAPDKAAANYERLITEDKVDLIMGPYGTGTISAAIPVAERYGYTIMYHSGSLTYTYGYDCAFPAWGSGRYPNETLVAAILDMLESTGSPPETVGFVVNLFPGSNFVAHGTTDGDATDAIGGVQVAEDRGYEVVLDVSYPSDISDWAPIAAQVKAAAPDFLFVGALGLDGINLIQAMDAIDFRPEGEYYLWPAPGPLAGLGDASEGIFLAAMFEPSMPQADNPEVKSIVEEFTARATGAGLYPVFETQAAASWTAWQMLTEAVEGSESLDQQDICGWLADNPVETLAYGEVRFDPAQNNFYGDQGKIAQLRDGEWLVVWPRENSFPENEPIYPTRP